MMSIRDETMTRQLKKFKHKLLELKSSHKLNDFIYYLVCVTQRASINCSMCTLDYY